MNSEVLLTIPELMKFLKIKRNTVYVLREQGLPTIKLGRSVRFRLSSVLEWLASLEDNNADVAVKAVVDYSHLL
ncbi:MAG: helix-turn-helix domain-containing protein [Candidatus Riflebacteria bacterium]|nr:helix-turn-helix domain-containing protein [Candidatus Riflebacteria bacterium]